VNGLIFSCAELSCAEWQFFRRSVSWRYFWRSSKSFMSISCPSI